MRKQYTSSVRKRCEWPRGYAHEQVTKMVWHFGAILGFDVTNGHDKDMHASWAIGAMGVLQNVLDEAE